MSKKKSNISNYSKKSGFQKVLGRTDYVVKMAINRIEQVPFKEVVTVLDFRSQ